MIEELLKEAIKKFAGKLPIILKVGIVKAVFDDDTCTVDNYEDVRLSAIIDNLESKFVVYPKIGSKVIIGILEDRSDAVVVTVSEPDKITAKIGTLLFEMKNGKFTIQSGSNNLKTILNTAFDTLNNAQLIVPGGLGSFSPADKIVFQQLKGQVNQMLE